jgi:hypothetical protein
MWDCAVLPRSKVARLNSAFHVAHHKHRPCHEVTIKDRLRCCCLLAALPLIGVCRCCLSCALCWATWGLQPTMS